MPVNDVDWSRAEKEVAQAAFDKAYKREVETLVKDVRDKASTIAGLDDIWQLNDFLNARRHEIDGKYDYRYASLIFVFAELVKEGWLHLEELKGLDAGKLAKISALTRM